MPAPGTVIVNVVASAPETDPKTTPAATQADFNQPNETGKIPSQIAHPIQQTRHYLSPPPENRAVTITIIALK